MRLYGLRNGKDEMIIFSTLVWGESFTKTFIDYVLPCVLEDIVGINAEKEYWITTTPEDSEAIRYCESFKKLKDISKFSLTRDIHGDQQAIVRGYTKKIALEAFEKDAHLKFIAPDTFYAGLKNLWGKIQSENKRGAVLPMGAFRVNPTILNDVFIKGYKTPKELFDLAMKNLHSEMISHDKDRPFFSQYPAQEISFKNGFQVNSYISQPQFIRARRKPDCTFAEFNYIDCLDLEDIYFIENVEEYFEASMKTHVHLAEGEYKPNLITDYVSSVVKISENMKEVYKRGYKHEQN